MRRGRRRDSRACPRYITSAATIALAITHSRFWRASVLSRADSPARSPVSFFEKLIAGLGDAILDGVFGDRFVRANGQRLGGEVDVGLANPIEATDRTLDGQRAVRAVHPANLESLGFKLGFHWRSLGG